jgi:crotonobetainyl-CoA:carnitine CoA-transferase CaiB-like acyl-CoA transferase
MAIKGPLTGVRVLDMTQAHAGPFGSQILGDMGAEVIKIESPEGDMIRKAPPWHDNNPALSYYAMALGRNKRCIVLDMYTKTGKEALYDLVKVSDVVFDNFRAGSMERLGADYETLKKINPKIISCSISGYGSSGPYANQPSFDDIAQGISGMAGLCGEPGGRPMRSGGAVADISAGIYAAFGIVIALYEREHTGKGRKVEVNLIDATMSLLANHFQNYFISGKVPPPQGSIHPILPTLGYFKTKDGYVAIGPSWPRLARAINREDMIEDPRFSDILAQIMNHGAFVKELEGALQEADSEDWVELLRAEDIPSGPINTLDKVVEDPQVIHNKTVISMEHPEYGKVRAIACPIKVIDGIEGENTPAGLVGEHTDEVLKEALGYSDEKIANLKKEQEEHAEELEPHLHKLT